MTLYPKPCWRCMPRWSFQSGTETKKNDDGKYSYASPWQGMVVTMNIICNNSVINEIQSSILVTFGVNPSSKTFIFSNPKHKSQFSKVLYKNKSLSTLPYHLHKANWYKNELQETVYPYLTFQIKQMYWTPSAFHTIYQTGKKIRITRGPKGETFLAKSAEENSFHRSCTTKNTKNIR